MKRNIVAIGGGQVFVPCQPPETLAIDEYIVGLAQQNLSLAGLQRKPRVLFIPTANGDDLGYCNTIYTLYELRLGCQFDHLRLLAERLTADEIRRKISWADIIYVGGGNTLRMMRAWRRRGVDEVLKAAYNDGTVMCGLSAGAICWFDAGISDSLRKPWLKDWEPILVKGLGLVPAACCPHYDSEGYWRQPACEKTLRRHPSLRLIALEDLCALHLTDGILYRTLSCAGKQCYNMFQDGGITFVEEIDEGTTASLFIK
jgi:dipeptidase E